MQTTALPQTAKTLDRDSLLLASLVLKDVNQLIRGLQLMVAVLLRYVAMGTSIANGLIDLTTSK